MPGTAAAYAASAADVSPVEAHATVEKPEVARPRDARGHAAVLEGERRVLAFVLDEEPREGELLAERAARVEPRRALGLAHDGALRKVREDVLAKTPDTARLERPRRLRGRGGAPPVEEIPPRLAGPPERAELGDDVEEAAAGGAGRARSGQRETRAAVEAPERREPAHVRAPASLVPRRSMRCTRARAATPVRFHAATAARPILSASLDSSVRPTSDGPAPARQAPYAPASRRASSAARPPRTSGRRFGSTSRS